MADLGALAKGPSPGVYDDTFKLARTIISGVELIAYFLFVSSCPVAGETARWHIDFQIEATKFLHESGIINVIKHF